MRGGGGDDYGRCYGLLGGEKGRGGIAEFRCDQGGEENGKPVRNAAVVLHPVKKNGDQSLGGLELKTDGDGKTSIDGIPYGKLRIQVLAPHFKTYGEDFVINQPKVDITVKLEKPSDQYSIYK